MQHNFAEHEWVTDFSEFEAVLVCRNDLAAFDPEVCLRAYQTFKWDEASTPGNDLAFRHEATGALVRHDGFVVAIDTLHNDPVEPLQDLFRVLHGLGWSKAEVYHPPETMALMLRDMGKAIPAQLAESGFDIQPAAAMTKISNFAESKALVSRGQEILKNSRGANHNVNSTMLNELESITSEILDGDSAQGETVVTALSVLSGGAFQNFDLDDDEPEGVKSLDGPDSGNEVRQVFSSAVAPAGTSEAAAEFGLFNPSVASREEEMVSQLSPGRSDNGDGELAQMVLENERLHEELKAVQEARWQLARAGAEADAKAGKFETETGQLLERIGNLELELSAAADREELAQEQSANNGVTHENLMTEIIGLRDQLNKDKERGIMELDVVRIGASAICFDFPAAPLSGGAIDHMVTDCGFEEVVHLHIGAIDQSVRWDVLGEISAQYPWEAENLAYGMQFPDQNCALMASIFLDLKAKIPQAQLRDLLRASMNGSDEKSEFREALAGGVPPSMRLLFGRQLPLENFDAAVLRLSPLMLCAEGRAFVDIRSGGEGLDIFTVRGLLDSFAAKLFVVHVDPLDGPFVKMIADLLRFVALAVNNTSRYEAVEIQSLVPRLNVADDDSPTERLDGCQEEGPVGESNEKKLHDLNIVFSDFVQGLQRLGIGAGS